MEWLHQSPHLNVIICASTTPSLGLNTNQVILVRHAIEIMVLVPVATIGGRDIVFDYLEIDSPITKTLLK